MSWSPEGHEPEYQGSIWKHPYAIYIVLNLVLFGILLGIGYIAYHNGWIPHR
jgi:hypothetical protein